MAVTTGSLQLTGCRGAACCIFNEMLYCVQLQWGGRCRPPPANPVRVEAQTSSKRPPECALLQQPFQWAHQLRSHATAQPHAPIHKQHAVTWSETNGQKLRWWTKSRHRRIAGGRSVIGLR
eukprot:SAG25_NODE_3952_length_921_cov_1.322384_1_plen_120_part_10